MMNDDDSIMMLMYTYITLNPNAKIPLKPFIRPLYPAELEW